MIAAAALYKRKPKTFAEEGDDSGWDEQDEELAKGAPLESLGPENNLAPGDRPWWKYEEATNSPLVPSGDPDSYAKVDEDIPVEPEAAKGVSSKGAPISDAVANGDTTPDTAPAVPADRPMSTWERYRQAEAQMPVKTKAPWYQDLAARGLGFASGWVNAAGHLRNPINSQAAEEEIRHPGFAEKQQVFESGMNPIRAELAAEMGQREQELKAQDTAAQAQLRQAQATQAAGRGHWYEAQAGQKWQVDHQSGLIYNKDTGQAIPLPRTSDKAQTYNDVLKLTGDKTAALEAAFGVKGTITRPTSPMDEARAILLHPEQHPPDVVQRAQALVHPPKQFAPQRSGGAGPRPPGAASFGAAEGQRSAAYIKAESDYNRLMNAANANPNPAAQKVLREQAATNRARVKQLADEAFTRRVGALTGTQGGVAAPPNFLKFANGPNGRIGFNATTKQWEPAPAQ